MLDVLTGFLNEPRAPNPPPVRRWEKVVAALLLVLGLVEAAFEPLVGWRPLAAALVVVIVPFLLLRRQRPLLSAMVPLGLMGAAEIATWIADVDSTTVGVTFFASLVFVYTLARWASGREIGLGFAFIVVATIGGQSQQSRSVIVDIIVSSTIWLLVGAVGLIVRARARAREREVAAARSGEREQLARELHDTVAHHVSAIAIQAQAGRLLASSDPTAAAASLATIEEAASQTLAEMRRMVSVLREDEAAELRPQAGLADLEALGDSAGGGGGGAQVSVTVDGDAAGIDAALEASVYRVAQEAITNARRHARNASSIDVRVLIEDAAVSVTVVDDGDVVGVATGRDQGYGLVGMRERTELLGGSFEAGPHQPRGWRVAARLPKVAGQ